MGRPPACMQLLGQARGRLACSQSASCSRRWTSVSSNATCNIPGRRGRAPAAPLAARGRQSISLQRAQAQSVIHVPRSKLRTKCGAANDLAQAASGRMRSESHAWAGSAQSEAKRQKSGRALSQVCVRSSRSAAEARLLFTSVNPLGSGSQSRHSHATVSCRTLAGR